MKLGIIIFFGMIILIISVTAVLFSVFPQTKVTERIGILGQMPDWFHYADDIVGWQTSLILSNLLKMASRDNITQLDVYGTLFLSPHEAQLLTSFSNITVFHPLVYGPYKGSGVTIENNSRLGGTPS